MIVNKFSLRVILVLLVILEISFSQNEEVTLSDRQLANLTISMSRLPSHVLGRKESATTNEKITETTTLEPVSNTICSLCACSDAIVDCVNQSLSSFFELPDWDGLQDFKPTTVDISQNPISTITRIGKLPIQILNLSNCDITTIEGASFIYLEDLTVLDLSRNKISTSSVNRRVFCGPLSPTGPTDFKKMQSLSLAHNDLHSLTQDIFLYMPGLTYLDLSGNPLVYIDQVTMGAVSDLKNLRELRLSGCELETLPEGLLRRQRRLRHLDLSDNRFSTIPSVLSEAINLVYLNLDKNPLRSLEANNALSTLTKLQDLHLSRLSRLQNVTSGALGGLTDLVTLRLSNNPRLTNLDPEFLMVVNEDEEELWPMLKELYLNNNNLSSIPSSLLDSWNELVTGDFSANPYNCDCTNQWMVDVLVPLLRNTPANVTIGNMICRKPSEMRGMTFAQLNDASRTLMCPQSENLEEPEVSNLAILLGIMIGIIVTFPLVLILVLLWRRGFFSNRLRKNYDSDDEKEDL